ncbi:hypothetical protein [Actinoplanes xinjiangensis]|uniref:hypothetical protein n=1 Tax=Actinoplanes xinjiangensis TaxID=512350 RepID=UPI003416EB28
MTTDQLRDLFEELREETVPTIQPPGAGTARRTLRRRRAAGAAVSAAAAVVAIAGGVTVVTGGGHPAPRPTTAAPAASTGPEHAALHTITAATNGPAVTVASPVTAGYEWTDKIYAPVLRITATCAGTGEITLSITGGTPMDHNRFDPSDMQITLPCTASPRPLREELMTGSDNRLTVRLVAEKGAAGRSGFAFSLTGTGDQELAPDDERLDIATLMGSAGRLPDGRTVRSGGGAPSFEPGHEFGGYGWHAEFPDSERYDLALACRGAGTFTVELRRSAETDVEDVQAGRRTGKLLAKQTIPCSAVPERHEFPIPKALGKGVAIWEHYENRTGTIGTVAWALIVR